MIKKFHYTSRFNRKLKEFPKASRLEIVEELNLFMQNPKEPSFRLHQLEGSLKNHYSISLGSDVRLILRFLKADRSEILFYDIGTHEIYLN